MKLVILNMKEQLKYDIIKKVKDGKLSKNSAQISGLHQIIVPILDKL